jgi:hypothetical protein
MKPAELHLRVLFISFALLATCRSSQVADEAYFPGGAFDKDDKKENDWWATEYCRYLRAMSEPSLWKLSEDDRSATAYRVLWIPSFHHPISARIVRSGETATLHVVELQISPDGTPGKILLKQTRKLTNDEWTFAQVYLEKSRFWNLKRPTGRKTGIMVDHDGDLLLCEGVDRGRYHIVERLDADPGYERLCKYILDLSGLKISEAWAEYHVESAGGEKHDK